MGSCQASRVTVDDPLNRRIKLDCVAMVSSVWIGQGRSFSGLLQRVLEASSVPSVQPANSVAKTKRLIDTTCKCLLAGRF